MKMEELRNFINKQAKELADFMWKWQEETCEEFGMPKKLNGVIGLSFTQMKLDQVPPKAVPSGFYDITNAAGVKQIVEVVSYNPTQDLVVIDWALGADESRDISVMSSALFRELFNPVVR